MVALLLAGAVAGGTSVNDFSAPAEVQARSLLRRVRRHGKLEGERNLPRVLERIMEGRRRLPSRDELERYVEREGLAASHVGGDLATPIPRARYFVIHDTSYPYYGDQPFPNRATLDSPEWKGNSLEMWSRVQVTHVYVTRRGESLTIRDFREPMRATKFERQKSAARTGLFLHVELVQPRRRDPEGSAKNDAIAPEPGFTSAQMERLALLYVTASVRRGAWLIPAFHAAVDAGIPDAHDDPQNFELDTWARAVDRLIGRLD